MSVSSKAVFLSYASQDAEAAKRICEALRAAGVEVWFDKNELVGGDAWDQKIRRQIKECALFVPIISANTQARLEGYFRLEWKLAEDRSHLMARGKPFIVPLVVDDTSDRDAHVPDSFLAVQWTRLPAGATSEFAERISALLRGPALETGRPRPVQVDDGVPSPRKGMRGRWLVAASVCGVVAIGALVVFARWRSGAERKGATGPATEFSEARKLTLQARALIDDDLLAIRENYRLAEELCRKAVALDVGDGEAWATWARVSAGMIQRNYDDSASRRAALRSQAERAIRLAPESVEAGLAIAAQLMIAGSVEEAETRLRDLLAKAPRDPRVPLSLAQVLRRIGKVAEATELRLNHPAFGGRDPRPLVDEARAIAFGSPAEAAALVDRAQAMAPSLDGYTLKLMLVTQVGGDLEAGRALVKTIPARIQQEDAIAAYTARLWLWVGDGDMALAALRRCPNEFLEEGRNFGFTPKGNLAGWAHQISGRTAAAKAEWTQALAVVEKRIVAEPERVDFLRWKAQLLALLARASEADKAWQLYTELAGRNGVPLLHAAEFEVAMGRKEEAIGRVQAVAATEWGPRFYASGLRYNPWFAAIRDDPRVQALIAEGQAKDVAEQGAGTAGPQGAPRPRNPNVDPKSVVVLPFANLSGDPTQEYFSDGLTEEILNALARERDLRVVPRTSAFSFKGKNLPLPEIAKALNVAQVVEGSVQRAGNRVRILCTLTRVADGFPVALPAFDRELKDGADIFTLEGEVARAVVEKLTQRTTTTAPVAVLTKNSAAYDAFLRARALQFRRATGPSAYEAMREYDEIVRLDPTFGLAWAQLAEVAAGLGNTSSGFDMSEATRARAVEAATQAVRLAPDLADAHVARAVVCLAIQQDLDGAARELQEAERLQPFNAGLARVRVTVEAPTASNARLVELATRAVDLDPQNASTLTAMGQLLWRKGEFAHAENWLRRATIVGESQNAFLTRGLNWAAWTGDVGHAIAIASACPDQFRNELFYRVVAPLYEQDRNEAQAVATWEKARELAEKEIQTPGIRSAHVQILIELGRHAALANHSQRAKAHFDQARHELDVLLQEQPHTFQFLMRQVQWLAAQARFTEALATFEKLAGFAPDAKFRVPGNLTGISAGDPGETKARLLAASGNIDGAINQLRRLQVGGRAFGYTLRLTPEFKPLRAVPAFQVLMRDAEESANVIPPPNE